MLLLLLRHGHDDRWTGEDPPLSAFGAEQVRATAAVLAGLCPDGIEEVWISPARRARESAALVRETLVTGWERIDEGLAPGAGTERHLEIIAAGRRNGLQSLLIVGHNPDLGAAALQWMGKSDGLERGLLAHGECLHLWLNEDRGTEGQPLMVVSGASVRTVDLKSPAVPSS